MINGSGSCTRDLPIATVKGEVKGCEEKQFELLMVLINWRSHLTWFDFEHSYTVVRTLPTLCGTYFGAMVVDVTVFTTVVAVAEFDGQRLYHRKEHHLALLLVAHFCL